MARLTTKRRKKLPSRLFGLPKSRKYPLDTAKRARSALSRVEQFGNSVAIHKVRAKAHKLYPKMKIKGLKT